MIEYAKLVENATDCLDQVRPGLVGDAHAQKNADLLKEAEVWAILALSLATRGG